MQCLRTSEGYLDGRIHSHYEMGIDAVASVFAGLLGMQISF